MYVVLTIKAFRKTKTHAFDWLDLTWMLYIDNVSIYYMYIIFYTHVYTVDAYANIYGIQKDTFYVITIQIARQMYIINNLHTLGN